MFQNSFHIIGRTQSISDCVPVPTADSGNFIDSVSTLTDGWHPLLRTRLANLVFDSCCYSSKSDNMRKGQLVFKMASQKRFNAAVTRTPYTVVTPKPELKSDKLPNANNDSPRMAIRSDDEEAFRIFLKNNMRRFTVSQSFLDKLHSRIAKL